MALNSFTLHNPISLREAVDMLDATDANNRQVRIMAGGQDLLTEMKERIVEPQVVVNIKHVGGLDKITYDPAAGLHIGALVKIAAIAEHPDVIRHFPALAMAASVIGSPQIRHEGTIGGNLCQRPRCWYYRNEKILCLKKGGDRCYAVTGENKYNAILGGGPSFIVHPSDTAPALVALGAHITITGPKGARTIPLESFFVLPRQDVRHENMLKPNEIVTAITVPASPLAAHSAYLKFRERTSMDWAMASAAAALHITGGVVTDARIVLGGVAPIPWRVPHAEAMLKGKPVPQYGRLQAVADAALDGAMALEHNGYKIPLAKTLVRRAIMQAMALSA